MKEYNRYLKEKLGTFGSRKATDEEMDELIKIIANAVIAPDSQLRKYVSDKTIHAGNGVDIVKELLSNPDPSIEDMLLDLDELWDFDAEELHNLKRDLDLI